MIFLIFLIRVILHKDIRNPLEETGIRSLERERRLNKLIEALESTNLKEKKQREYLNYELKYDQEQGEVVSGEEQVVSGEEVREGEVKYAQEQDEVVINKEERDRQVEQKEEEDRFPIEDYITYEGHITYIDIPGILFHMYLRELKRRFKENVLKKLSREYFILTIKNAGRTLIDKSFDFKSKIVSGLYFIGGYASKKDEQ